MKKPEPASRPIYLCADALAYICSFVKGSRLDDDQLKEKPTRVDDLRLVCRYFWRNISIYRHAMPRNEHKRMCISVSNNVILWLKETLDHWPDLGTMV